MNGWMIPVWMQQRQAVRRVSRWRTCFDAPPSEPKPWNIMECIAICYHGIPTSSIYIITYIYIYISIHIYIYRYIYIIMCIYIYIDNHIIIYPYQFHIPCPGRAWSSWWARIVTRCWWPFCRWPPPFRATSGCKPPPWPPAPFPMGALASPPSHWGRENTGCSTEPC